MAADLDEAISKRAYEIWESEGRPEGRGSEHWARAEAELRSFAGSEAKEPAAPAKAPRSRSKTAGKTRPSP